MILTQPKLWNHGVSALLHLMGAVMSVLATLLLIHTALQHGTVWHLVSFAIFGVSLFCLYTSSTLYHAANFNNRTAALLRRIDHIMIFVLIAGTYTPFCVVPLRGPWGYGLLTVIWGLALTGLILKVFWFEVPRWLSTGIYLLMGWMALVAVYPMIKTIPVGGLLWLLAGGLAYSLGAVIYGIKKPDPFPDHFGFHEIWHLFVLGGSFCHFWAVYAYVAYL